MASKERTSSGATRRTWGTLVELPGSVQPMTGRELRDAQQVDGRITHKLVVRYHPDVSRAGRFVLEKPGREPRVFNIVHVLNLDERDAWLQVSAEERVQG